MHSVESPAELSSSESAETWDCQKLVDVAEKSITKGFGEGSWDAQAWASQ
jgi:hypothetical protein